MARAAFLECLCPNRPLSLCPLRGAPSPPPWVLQSAASAGGLLVGGLGGEPGAASWGQRSVCQWRAFLTPERAWRVMAESRAVGSTSEVSVWSRGSEPPPPLRLQAHVGPSVPPLPGGRPLCPRAPRPSTRSSGSECLASWPPFGALEALERWALPKSKGAGRENGGVCWKGSESFF